MSNEWSRNTLVPNIHVNYIGIKLTSYTTKLSGKKVIEQVKRRDPDCRESILSYARKVYDISYLSFIRGCQKGTKTKKETYIKFLLTWRKYIIKCLDKCCGRLWKNKGVPVTYNLNYIWYFMNQLLFYCMNFFWKKSNTCQNCKITYLWMLNVSKIWYVWSLNKYYLFIPASVCMWWPN